MCSKMFLLAGAADWSRKKEIKVGRDASQCRCTCTRCSLQILLPILLLAFFFSFFSSVFPLFSFPAFHRIKHSFIDTIVAINFLSLFGSYVSEGLSRMVKITRNTTSTQKYQKFGIAMCLEEYKNLKKNQ